MADVKFNLDGTPLVAKPGHTLASVIFQRSARRCRTSVSGTPRGPLCGMGVCFECRVTVNGRPHVRSCMEQVRAGMDVRTVTPACYEPPGGAPGLRNSGQPPIADLATDVLVVGAGPAGLSAADAALKSGANVLIVDENPRVGGQIWRADAAVGLPGPAAVLRQRIADGGARFLHGTVIDGTAGDALVQAPEGTTSRVRAAATVLATGAREIFHPFAGWTLPGVVGAGGLQALVKGGLDVRGLTILVAGNGPLLLAVAAHLRRHGAAVVGLCEGASKRRIQSLGARLIGHPRKLAQGMGLLRSLRGTPIFHQTRVMRAMGTERVERVAIDGRHAATLDVDLVAIGDGLIPQSEIAHLFGCAIENGRVRVDVFQTTSVAGVFSAGEATGVGGVDLALAEGAIAGHAASDDAPSARRGFSRRRRERRFARALERAYDAPLPPAPPPDTVVCRCEDVTLGELLAHDAPHVTLRDLKLQTRCGMGPCQGRICGAANQAMLGRAPDLGRPPLLPIPVESLVHPRHR